MCAIVSLDDSAISHGLCRLRSEEARCYDLEYKSGQSACFGLV